MKMRIKFIKPAPGWAYSENDIVDVPESKADFLVNNGYAIRTIQPRKHDSQMMVEKAIQQRKECSQGQ